MNDLLLYLIYREKHLKLERDKLYYPKTTNKNEKGIAKLNGKLYEINKIINLINNNKIVETTTYEKSKVTHLTKIKNMVLKELEGEKE